ncbi:DUF3889 domain-containing protein [Alkalihalobacillus sp. AL-G]|uniref:DUF3889 domain-containing protein n=1 Tax=Alkalihalobacillus sp. AL-G TaxID=2926399 RepID=UPI00272D4B5A|nr:DUF3889 domain-containing protein [Alkalihalobacillus sp. AL-G]WLD92491.1 YqzG/YhdC family protein [Alkalihalobacillus sp. AL-G]
MKLVISIQLILCILLFENYTTSKSPNNAINRNQEVPPHAKWGQIAMQKTKEKYPKAAIIDYLHIGREKGTQYSTEKFKLWLKEEGKEFGVFVDIKFNNETEQIMDIKYMKTSK